MAAILGVPIALEAEAYALLGKQGWRRTAASAKRLVFQGAGSGLSFVSVISGPGYDNSGSATRWLIDQGADLVVSVGVSGGLDPNLRSGDVVIAERTLEVDEKGRRAWELDRLYSESLHTIALRLGLPVTLGPVESLQYPLLTADDKKIHFHDHGALCVDMESAAVARAAKEMNVPCMVVRAVCDEADKSIPRQTLGGLNAAGGINLPPLLWSILKRPVLIRRLLGLKKDFTRAMEALRPIFPGAGQVPPGEGVLFQAVSAVRAIYPTKPADSPSYH